MITKEPLTKTTQEEFDKIKPHINGNQNVFYYLNADLKPQNILSAL